MQLIQIALLLLPIICRPCTTISLNCYFHMSRYTDGVGEIYECASPYPTLDPEFPDIITSVSGTHEAGKSNANVEGIYISSSNLEMLFPVNFHSFFPNLKLIIIKSAIPRIVRSHISAFPNLMYLDLFGNKIRSIDSNLFNGFNKMTYIDFGYNRIQHMHGDDFIVPSTVQHLNFDNNVCINEYGTTGEAIREIKTTLETNCSTDFLLSELLVRNKALEQSLSEFRDVIGNDLKSLNRSMENFTEDMNKVNGHVNTLADRIDVLTISVTGVSHQVNSVDQRASVLEQSMEKFTEDMNKVNGHVDTLADRIDVLTNSVTGVSDQVNSVDQRASVLEQSMGNFTEDMNKINGHVNILADRIDILTISVVGVTHLVNSVDQRASVLEQSMENFTEDMNKVNGHVESKCSGAKSIGTER